MFVYRLFMFNLHYLAQIKQNYTDFKHRQSMLLHATIMWDMKMKTPILNGEIPYTCVGYSLISVFMSGTYHVFVSCSVGVWAPGKWNACW